MRELIELINKVKASNVGKDIHLFSCGNDLLSDMDEYYGCKIAHLPESKSFPEHNNKIYIIPIPSESDIPIAYKHYDYEIVENESNEFEAVKKYNVTKEEAEVFKEYLEEKM